MNMKIKDITLGYKDWDKFNIPVSEEVVIPGFVTDPDTGELCRVTALASYLFNEPPLDTHSDSHLRHSITSIVVPPTVTVIKNSCFLGLSNLSKVILPDGIKVLSAHVFCGCSNLVDVTLPAFLEEIGKVAFSGCRSLKELKLPNSVKKIGEHAFTYCLKLEDVEVPSTVEYVGEDAFRHVPHITYHGNLPGAPWGAQSMN